MSQVPIFSMLLLLVFFCMFAECLQNTTSHLHRSSSFIIRFFPFPLFHYRNWHHFSSFFLLCIIPSSLYLFHHLPLPFLHLSFPLLFFSLFLSVYLFLPCLFLFLSLKIRSIVEANLEMLKCNLYLFLGILRTQKKYKVVITHENNITATHVLCNNRARLRTELIGSTFYKCLDTGLWNYISSRNSTSKHVTVL
jgi:hypothetical protein